ncbi:MAG TPA: YggT family protein [Candidatus Acidoferrales bacterium]|nr:YggT family protein [Candidatus Acidoferrales bacterium]
MIGNFFGALGVVLNLLLNGLMLVILANAVLSWFPHDRGNPIVQLLERVSDFVCGPIRRLFPTVVSGLDLAPMIAMLLLIFLQRWLVPTLSGL